MTIVQKELIMIKKATIKTIIAAFVFAALPTWAADVTLSKAVTKASDGSDVPLEIATPVGKGPFPPVL